MKLTRKEELLLEIGLFCCGPVTCVVFMVIYDYIYMYSALFGVVIFLAISFFYILCLVFFVTILAIVFGWQVEDSEELTEESEQKAISSDHGGHFEEVMENIRHEKLEYRAIFDLNGRKLAEGTLLSPEKCNITTEDWRSIYRRREGVVDLHNHPGRSNVAFSGKDFEAFLSSDFIRKMIVTTRNYNYVLEKPSDEDGYEDLQDDIYDYVIKMNGKYIWLSIFSSRLWSVVVARKTAKCFGLKFSIEHIHRQMPKKYVFLGVIACTVALMFCFIRPQFTTPSSASATVSINCNPADDPCIQGNAPIGGGWQNQ